MRVFGLAERVIVLAPFAHPLPIRHPGESRVPFSLFGFSARDASKWIPAFAGMTVSVNVVAYLGA